MEKIAKSISSGSPEQIADIFCEDLSLRDILYEKIRGIITAEITNLCKKSEPSILRQTSKTELKQFSWESLHKEFSEKTPLFLKFLYACISNPQQEKNTRKTQKSILPAMLSAGAKLVSVFNEEMTALRKINSIILKKAGMKKIGFTRLISTYDCMSYQATHNMLDSFGEDHDSRLLQWKSDFEYGSGSGYIIASDNVDWEIKPRHVTTTSQTQSIHKTHVLAVKNRVPSNHLPESFPTGSIKDMELRAFLPTPEDNIEFERHLCLIIAHTWAEHIPHFAWVKSVIPDHVTHPYEQSMKSKSECVSMIYIISKFG